MEVILIFLSGLVVGSFLNVLIDRIPSGESFSKGRSHCDFCKKQIPWFDLIPVFSFFILRRKCRFCNSKISFQYPLVELMTGFLFLATFLFVFPSGFIIQGLSMISFFRLFYYLFFASCLMVIFFTDIKYGIIPDKILFPAIFISLVFLLLQYPNIPMANFLSGIGTFAFFLLLTIGTELILHKNGMGFGDVKYSFLMGVFLGFPNIIFGLYTAFLTGGLLSLILVLWGKKRFSGGTIPFGPFLVFGTFFVFFFGDLILKKISPLL